MKFSIIVYAAPYSSEAAVTAYNFTRAVLAQGHEIYRLFFFSDGVHNAAGMVLRPGDEINLQDGWGRLIKEHKLDSVVCVSSALSRGILNAREAQRHGLAAASLHEGSEIAGLGQLIDAAIHSDRLVNFG